MLKTYLKRILEKLEIFSWTIMTAGAIIMLYKWHEATWVTYLVAGFCFVLALLLSFIVNLKEKKEEEK